MADVIPTRNADAGITIPSRDTSARYLSASTVSPLRTADVVYTPPRDIQTVGAVPARQDTTESVLTAPSRDTSARYTSTTIVSPSRSTVGIGSGSSNPTTSPSAGNNASIFDTLADVYKNMFGQSQGISPVQSPQVVPVPIGESGGGSNITLVLLVLGLAGVAIWYFYFRS